MSIAYELLREKLLRLYPALEGESGDKGLDKSEDEDKGWIPTSCHAAIRVVPPRTQLGSQ